MATGDDGATDRLLRDTFGVTDEGMEKLKKMAEEDKKRRERNPTPSRKGKATHHPPGD